MSFDPSARLDDFDGRDPKPLEEIAKTLDDDDLESVVDAITDDDLRIQVGSTWILKRWIETGGTLSPHVAGQLVDSLATVRAPEAQLHLLQVLPRLALDPERVDAIFARAIDLTGSEHTFVRAWAYNALAFAATLDPTRRDEVEAQLDAAANDKASVRARIRNARQGRFTP